MVIGGARGPNWSKKLRGAIQSVLSSIVAAPQVVWSTFASASVTATGSSLSKGSADGWQGASSNQAATGTRKLVFTKSVVASDTMCGLAVATAAAGYSWIDYALYADGSGWLQVYELGVNKYAASQTSYVATDTLSVESDGTTVTYKKNGVAFYTSATSASGKSLRPGAALGNYLGVHIQNATIQ